MEISGHLEANKNESTSNKKFINFSELRNGYLKRWIRDYLHSKIDIKASLNLKEILSLIFMIAIVIRIMKMITVTDSESKILIYLGSPWNRLGGNNVYIETLFLLWSINFILFYLFVIKSDCKQYKWLQIFQFLSGSVSYNKIGINFFKI